jgi:hypothetical protein
MSRIILKVSICAWNRPNKARSIKARTEAVVSCMVSETMRFHHHFRKHFLTQPRLFMPNKPSDTKKGSRMSSKGRLQTYEPVELVLDMR